MAAVTERLYNQKLRNQDASNGLWQACAKVCSSIPNLITEKEISRAAGFTHGLRTALDDDRHADTPPPLGFKNYSAEWLAGRVDGWLRGLDEEWTWT